MLPESSMAKIKLGLTELVVKSGVVSNERGAAIEAEDKRRNVRVTQLIFDIIFITISSYEQVLNVSI